MPRALYGLLGERPDDGRDADALAYDREPDEYRHARLLDHRRGDWATRSPAASCTSIADEVRLEALVEGRGTPLAELVGEDPARGALPPDARRRLARPAGARDGEPRDRLVAALDALGAGRRDGVHAARRRAGLLEAGILDAPMAELEARWRASIAPVFAARPARCRRRPATPRGRLDHGSRSAGCGASSRPSDEPTRERPGERGRDPGRRRTARAGAIAGPRPTGRRRRRGRRPRGARRGDGPGAPDAVRRRPRDRPSASRSTPATARSGSRSCRRSSAARRSNSSRRRIADRLAAFGRPVEVTATFEVPWTSDRISPAGRAALRRRDRAAGPGRWLAPRPDRPGAARPVPALRLAPDGLENLFGPTQCRTIRYCADCRQPFEAIKTGLMSRAAPASAGDPHRDRRHRRRRDDGRRDRPGRPRGRLRGRPLRRRCRRPIERGARPDPRRPDAPARRRSASIRRDRRVGRGRGSTASATRRPSTGVADEADLVIEAALEDLELKRDDLPGARRGGRARGDPRHEHERPLGRRRSPRPRRRAGARPRPALLQPRAAHAARRGRRRAPTDPAVVDRAAAIVDGLGQDAGPVRRHAGLHRQPGQPAVHARGAAASSRPARRTSTDDRRGDPRGRLPDGPVRAHGPHRDRRQPRRRDRDLGRLRAARRGCARRRSRRGSSRPATSAGRRAPGSTDMPVRAGSARRGHRRRRARTSTSRRRRSATGSWRPSPRRRGSRSRKEWRRRSTIDLALRLGAGHPRGPFEPRVRA